MDDEGEKKDDTDTQRQKPPAVGFAGAISQLADRFLLRAGTALPRLSLRGWALLGAPMVATTSLFISTGPHFQKFLFSAVGGDAPNLYRAAFGETINRFPSLQSWLATAFWWPWLLMAGVMCILALRAPSMKLVLLNFVFLCAAVLTVADVLGAARATTGFQLSALMANILANVIGGIVVSLLLGVGLTLFRLTLDFLPWPRALPQLTAALVLGSFGLVLSIGSYTVLRALYEPFPARVAVAVAPPYSAFYMLNLIDDRFTPIGTALRPSFHFLPWSPTRAAISISAFGQPFVVRWATTTPGAIYDLEIRLFADCNFDQAMALATNAPFVSKHAVNALQLGFDGGSTTLEVPPADNRMFTLESDAGMAFVTRSSKDRSLSIDQIAVGNTRFTLQTQQKVDFLITAPFLGKQGASFKELPREFLVQADGERHVARFLRESTTDNSAKTSCQLITVPDAASATNQRQQTLLAGAISALVTINLETAPDSPQVLDAKLSANDYSGQTKVSDIPATAPTFNLLHYMRYVALRGGLSDLAVDSSNLSLRPNASLVLDGDLAAQFTDDGVVNISGNASSVSLDNVRVNKTRWETLSSEWQLALVSAFFAVVLTFLRVIWLRAQQFLDDDIKMLTA